jgi:SAM-dependent methyltransferase
VSLDDVAREWDALARRDPLWAILTDPGKKEDRWDPDEFFETGKHELNSVLTRCDQLGYPRQRRAALDFGCGVGRITQALADHFDRSVGVDISPTMIERARGLNRHGDSVTYAVNDSSDLGRFETGSFDLVFSIIVLQHMEPELSSSYIAELVRVCASDGLVFFQVPHGPVPGIPMPHDAYRAKISVVSMPATVAAGAWFTVEVRLVNASDRSWPASAARPIGLGNHWLDPDGRRVVSDDGRAHLSADLAAGGTTTLELECRAPGTPGMYLLEVDVVQERVTWFGEKRGTVPTQVPIEVVGLPSSDGGDEAGVGADGHMDMYGLPRPDVESVLRHAGAQILLVDELPRCGPDWISYDYYVTKPSRSGSWLRKALRFGTA